MAYDVAADIRLDPRLKALLAGMASEAQGDVDQILGRAQKKVGEIKKIFGQ